MHRIPVSRRLLDANIRRQTLDKVAFGSIGDHGCHLQGSDGPSRCSRPTSMKTTM